MLVEEFADGYEISIDAAVFQGQVTPFCLARKEIGYPPYAEEIGHYVDAADPLLADEQLIQVLADAHAAIEFTDGVTHTEIMMTADGPKVIEINARIGGDMIPYLGLQATGADPGLAAAAVATVARSRSWSRTGRWSAACGSSTSTRTTPCWTRSPSRRPTCRGRSTNWSG